MTRYTPIWLQQGSYAASVDRRLAGALWPVPSVTGCAVTVASAMTVNIAAGSVAVPTANNTGTVLCVSDAVEQVTLAAAPAAGSNRYDLITCQARGNDLDGGANNDFIFTNVTGTAAASPTVPATPNNAVSLAQIYVPGGSAAVTAGNITSSRPSTLAVAQGVLARAIQTTDTAQISSVGADLMSIGPIYIPANRRIQVTHHLNISAVVAGQSGAYSMIRMDGTLQGAGQGTGRVTQFNTISGTGCMFHGAQILTPAAGMHSFTVGVWAITQNVIVSGSQDNAYHEVRDLGPV